MKKPSFWRLLLQTTFGYGMPLECPGFIMTSMFFTGLLSRTCMARNIEHHPTVFKVGDHGYFGPDFIKEARDQVGVIQSHLKAAQNR